MAQGMKDFVLLVIACGLLQHLPDGRVEGLIY